MKSTQRIPNYGAPDEPRDKIITADFTLSLGEDLIASAPDTASEIRAWAERAPTPGIPHPVIWSAARATQEREAWLATPAKHRGPPQLPTPILCFGEEADWLWDPEYSPKPFALDYLDGPLGYRIVRAESDSSPLRKSLPKARDTSNKIVWDLCGGWRVDALLMAHWNFTVKSFERSPWVHLFSDRALERSRLLPEKEIKLETKCQDAREALDALAFTGEEAPSVIYIDPMYPNLDSSALNQVEMRFLHKLSSGGDIAAELLEKSLPIALDRVIIKRPVKADRLDRPANFHVEQGSTRYDIYLTGR